MICATMGLESSQAALSALPSSTKVQGSHSTVRRGACLVTAGAVVSVMDVDDDEEPPRLYEMILFALESSVEIMRGAGTGAVSVVDVDVEVDVDVDVDDESMLSEISFELESDEVMRGAVITGSVSVVDVNVDESEPVLKEIVFESLESESDEVEGIMGSDEKPELESPLLLSLLLLELELELLQQVAPAAC